LSKLAFYRSRLRYIYQIPFDASNVKNTAITRIDAQKSKYAADAETLLIGNPSAELLRIV
jgi:hypothetical protein